jgi:hypothetical protein
VSVLPALTLLFFLLQLQKRAGDALQKYSLVSVITWCLICCTIAVASAVNFLQPAVLTAWILWSPMRDREA